MHKCWYIITLSFIFALPVLADGYNQGVDLYNHGHYRQAYDILIIDATNGNPNAQFRVGFLLLYGEGMEKNEKLGLKWIEKSAVAGEFVAQAHLGELFFEGKFVEKNILEAYAWTYTAYKNFPDQLTKGQLERISSQLTNKQMYEANSLAKKYYQQYVTPYKD